MGCFLMSFPSCRPPVFLHQVDFRTPSPCATAKVQEVRNVDGEMFASDVFEPPIRLIRQLVAFIWFSL